MLACSDFIAIGILQGTRRAGLNVPHDLSLVGFDDMPFAELVYPVRKSIGAMGRAAFEQLLALINRTGTEPHT